MISTFLLSYHSCCFRVNISEVIKGWFFSQAIFCAPQRPQQARSIWQLWTKSFRRNTQLNPLRVFKARGISFFYYSLFFQNLRYVWSFWAICKLNRINRFPKLKFKSSRILLITDRRFGWKKDISYIIYFISHIMFARVNWYRYIGNLFFDRLIANTPWLLQIVNVMDQFVK